MLTYTGEPNVPCHYGPHNNDPSIKHYDDTRVNTFEVFHVNKDHKHIGHFPSLTMACSASNPEIFAQMDKLAAECLGNDYHPKHIYRQDEWETGLILELDGGDYIFATCQLYGG